MISKKKEIFLSLAPAILFILIYKVLSFKAAVIVGFLVGIIVYFYKIKKNRKLSSFDYLGIFELIVQTIIGVLAENPMTYFVYPIISNGISFIVFGGSLIISKDIISYLAKDYVDSEKILDFCKPVYRNVTILWTIFFAIKVGLKYIGIISWSFEILYGISWIMGYPATFVLIWFSFWYPTKYYNKYMALLD